MTAEILATGRHGLEYFRLFGPPHARLTGADFDFDRDYGARYDGAADLGFAALNADADRFTGVGAALSDIAVGLRNRGDSVFGAWEGGSADTAHQQFDTLLGAAGDLSAQFTNLADASRAVVDTADRTSHDKAEGVAKLHATHVAGRTADDVAFLVDVAPRLADADDDELARAAQLVGARFVRRTPATQAHLAAATADWLTNTFAEDFQWRAARFDALCTAAEGHLSAAWHALADALASVRADQFDAVLPALSTPPATTPIPVPQPPAPASAAASPAAALPAAAGVAATAPPEPDPLAPGTSVGADAMTPAGQRGPAPTPPATLPSTSAAPDGTQNFFGGLPLLGAPAGGGGDQDRQSSGLPTGPSAFVDVREPEHTTAIGATDDHRRYGDEDEPAAVQATSISALLDNPDDEEMW
jgi:hypothetical protein